MADFFSNLAKTMQSPQMQSALMSITGTPYEVQAPILQQQAKMQKMQQQEQAKAMLDKLLSEGDLSDEKILQVYTLSPELGNALVKMRESKAEQAMQQQIAGLVGGGGADADTMAKIGVLSGNPQLMQYADMLEDRKYRKGSYGELLNQPDGGGSNATWTQTGEDTVIGGAAPDTGGNIIASDLPPEQNQIDYTKMTVEEYGRINNIPVNTEKGRKQATSELAAERKNQIETQEKQKGVQKFDTILGKLYGDLEELSKNNLIPDENASVLDNISNYIAGTGLGQEYQKAIGSKKSTLEETSKSLRLRLTQAIMQATGMSSKQLDSNAELKAMIDSFGSPTATKQARQAILDTIAQTFGSGVPKADKGQPLTDLQSLSDDELMRLLQELPE